MTRPAPDFWRIFLPFSREVPVFRRNRILIPAACVLVLFSAREAIGGAKGKEPVPAPTAPAGPLSRHHSRLPMIRPEQGLLLLAGGPGEKMGPISLGPG